MDAPVCWNVYLILFWDVLQQIQDDSWKEEYLHQTENLCTRVCALRENRRHSDEYRAFKKPARSKPDEQIWNKQVF